MFLFGKKKKAEPVVEKKFYELYDKHEFTVAGVTFEGRQDILAPLKGKDDVPVTIEHAGTEDDYAIKILYDGKAVGYVKHVRANTFKKMESDIVSMKLHVYGGDGDKSYGAKLKVWVPKEVK